MSTLRPASLVSNASARSLAFSQSSRGVAMSVELHDHRGRFLERGPGEARKAKS